MNGFWIRPKNRAKSLYKQQLENLVWWYSGLLLKNPKALYSSKRIFLL